jgi:hypothetical protein
MKKYSRAMRVAAAAETFAQRAVQSVNKVTANPDALKNDLANWNKEFKQRIDQAVSIAKAKDPAKQEVPKAQIKADTNP